MLTVAVVVAYRVRDATEGTAPRVHKNGTAKAKLQRSTTYVMLLYRIWADDMYDIVLLHP